MTAKLDGDADGNLTPAPAGMMNRRRALRLMAAGSAVVMLGTCADDDGGSGETAEEGSGDETADTTAGETPSGTSGSGECTTMPEETAGPYPGDGSDGIPATGPTLPEDVCDDAYATDGYEQSVSNLSSLALETDGLCSDDEGESQLAAVTGSAKDGYTVSLTLAVDPDDPAAGAAGGGGGAPPGRPPG